MIGLASSLILLEHRAFNALGFTLKAFSLISFSLGCILLTGWANSSILGVALNTTIQFILSFNSVTIE